MVFFGPLLDHFTDDVVSFHVEREAAEAELAEILADEPAWVGKLEVVWVNFGGVEVEVTSLGRAFV